MKQTILTKTTDTADAPTNTGAFDKTLNSIETLTSGRSREESTRTVAAMRKMMEPVVDEAAQLVAEFLAVDKEHSGTLQRLMNIDCDLLRRRGVPEELVARFHRDVREVTQALSASIAELRAVPARVQQLDLDDLAPRAYEKRVLEKLPATFTPGAKQPEGPTRIALAVGLHRGAAKFLADRIAMIQHVAAQIEDRLRCAKAEPPRRTIKVEISQPVENPQHPRADTQFDVFEA